MEKQNVKYQGFKDLDCYKFSRELRIYVSMLVKKFPNNEEYLLKKQIIKSSRS